MADIRRPEFLRSNLLGELLRWNKHTTDNIDLLNRQLDEKQRMMLLLTANQSLANNSDVELIFSGVCTAYSVGETLSQSEPSYIRVGRTGDYSIRGHVSFAANATGQRCAYLNVNDERVAAVEHASSGSAFFTQLQVHIVLPLREGDLIGLSALQASGGALNAIGAGELSSPILAGRSALIVDWVGA